MTEIICVIMLGAVVVIQQIHIGKLMDRVQAKDLPEFKAMTTKVKPKEPKKPTEPLEQI